MTLPLYRTANESPPSRTATAHAGLWFDKFCNTWTDRWSMSADGDGHDNPKLKWISTVTNGAIGQADLIEEATHRLARLAERRGGRWLVFTTESQFVTGLGRSHPVENGFAWHPTLGAPYLPGSSVKGLVRGWAKQEQAEKEEIDLLLGARDKVGAIGFMDVLPVASARLEADVMTPHYAGWNKDDPPGDWRSPTPIPFLVTAVGTSFLFAIVPLCRASGDDMELVESWLCGALEWTGAGAKTAVGYGRFGRDDEKRAGLQRRCAELEQNRQGRIRHEREAREREEFLASLSSVEREIEGLLANRQDRAMPDTTAIHQQIESGRWSGEQKIEAAQWLKARMKTNGVWKETTQARRPDRDREYQRTLQIMGWLNRE